MLGKPIANAAKHGTRRASIAVQLVGRDDEVRLLIENSGRVIDQQVVELLFEPLRRGGEDSNAERTSLGLGLFIVRQIVRAHGRTVAVSSADAKTVFTVTLPKPPPRLT